MIKASSLFVVGAGFALLASSTLLAQLPAFPGAEGFGAYAVGGRYGDVYHVVNLNSSGAGSFAYGLSTVPAAGRTIVFDVSGYINISGTLTLNAPKVTIAGQTAPGDGIGVKGGTFNISSSDVIIRHFRFRDGYSADSIDIDSDSTNTILDHCDALLSNDENFSSFSSPPENVTFQWSINAWGMESHSCGGLWDQQHATCHHSLWSHNHTRNPKARPDGLLDWVNNVTFDWDIGFILGDSTTPANWKANVINSYFVCPPSNLRSVALEKASLDRNGVPNFTIFVDGCLMDANGNGVLDVSKSGGYDIASGDYATNPTAFPITAGIPVTTDDALTAYKKIVSAAGPLRLDAASARPLRDELDGILITNLVTQTPHHVSSPAGTGAANGGFGFLNSASAPIDTDHDGMPDYWEIATGSSVSSDDHTAAVPAGAFVAPGYTRLEEYLQFLAVPHAVLQINTATNPASLDVDLRRFTSGFNRAPVVFSIANVTNATVTLLPDGYTAHIVPPLNFTGRARFDFTVTDGDGSTWTQMFAGLVSAQEPPRDLLWHGDGSSNLWSTNAATWLDDGGMPALFRQGDYVTFDDSGFNSPAISVSGALVVGGLNFNAAQDYTIGGSGSLSGTAVLAKDGPGTLTLNVANSMSGTIYLNEGALVVGNNALSAAGQIDFQDGTSLTSTYGPTTRLTLNGPMSVPSGVTAAINMSPRVTLGQTAGGGTLNLSVSGTVNQYVYLAGSWSGFTGNLNVTGTAPNAAALLGCYFNGGSFDTLANASLYLDNVTLVGRDNSTGNTLNIGALSGSASGRLGGTEYAGPLTYKVGALNHDTTFAGSILDYTNNTTSPFTKVGTGNLTLSGTNFITGTLTISSGTLTVSGSTRAGSVNVAGGTLAGDGRVSGTVTLPAGGTVAPGDTFGSPGMLTLSNNLTLNGGTLYLDLAGDTTAGAGVNDLIQMRGGTLTLSGTTTVQPNLLDGLLVAGTYTLIDGGGATSGGGANLAWGPGTGRQTVSFDTSTAGKVRLNVGGSAASLVWTGNNGNNWDNNSTYNWLNGGVSDKYYNLDTVVFNDSSANGNVNVVGSLQPARVSFSNGVTDYTLGGGSLAGGMKLIKAGGATVYVNNNNTYTGGTFIYGGNVVMATNTVLGPGPITLAGGGVTLSAGNISNVIYCVGSGSLTGSTVSHSYLKIPVLGSGNLTIAPNGKITTEESYGTGFSGTFLFAGSGTFRFNQGGYAWGNPDVLFDTGTSTVTIRTRALEDVRVYLGGLAGGSASRLLASDQNVNPGSLDTFVVGGLDLDTAFAGSIQDGTAHVAALEKTGSGELTLSGDSTYTGGTMVAAGTLLVSNATGSGTGAGPVTVADGATLGGNGAIAGVVMIQNGGVLAPGNSAGSLTLGGDLILSPDAVLQFELGAVSDSVAVSGDLALGGVVNVAGLAGFSSGNYTLFTCGGSLSGSLALGSLPAGYNGGLDLSTPGQVNLVVQPKSPHFAAVQLNTAGLVVSGGGGAPGATYYILATTNLALPFSGWDRMKTNAFDAGGNFSFTNAITPGVPQRYYSLQVP